MNELVMSSEYLDFFGVFSFLHQLLIWSRMRYGFSLVEHIAQQYFSIVVIDSKYMKMLGSDTYSTHEIILSIQLVGCF